MVQLLTLIGRTKWGKITYILIFGLFMQSFSQQYGAYTEAWNTNPHDTTFLMRGTNQMYNRDGNGVLQPSIIVNPLRHIPFWLINSWPANFDSATMQTKVSNSRTININGTTQDLSANRTWIIPTGVASIYDKTGILSTSGKIFTDTFSVSTATPTISLSSYLSAMSCSNFKMLSATGFRASATTSNSPNVSITAITSNSVSLILNQTNSATVTILGINVLSGLPTILVPDPTNVKIVLSFVAW